MGQNMMIEPADSWMHYSRFPVSQQLLHQNGAPKQLGDELQVSAKYKNRKNCVTTWRPFAIRLIS